MKEDLISFDTAKLAKEKGFDWGCNHFYTSAKKPYATRGFEYRSDAYVEDCNWNNGFGSYPTKASDVLCSAPTQSLLQRWLREEQDIDVYIVPNGIAKKQGINLYHPCLWVKGDYQSEMHSEGVFENALEIGLQEALKLIKL